MNAVLMQKKDADSGSGKAGFRKTLSALTALRNGFSQSGRKLLRHVLPMLDRDNPARPVSNSSTVRELAAALLSTRGEAAGVAIATDLLNLYAQLDAGDRLKFFEMLASDFDPDERALVASWEKFRSEGPTALPQLFNVVEAPRQELFRRLNLAPGGTAALVRMREDLLALKRDLVSLERVDFDLKHLLQSWFNRGFLKMQSIDWSSPASLLELLIRYEAVHDITSWSDLRRRLAPTDRRCFAFFHPVMPDEPLIFVEVGLTIGIPDNIQDMLAADRVPIEPALATTATFYSINNCQRGLAGISFGHFLIKQVAADLKRELPGLDCFVTLSPLPGLMKWLRETEKPEHDQALVEALGTPEGFAALDKGSAQSFLLQHAVTYLTQTRDAVGKPRDPVARFHLGNGARLERLNWAADTSINGLRQSGGIMVNYLYDLAHLEENHEAFVEQGQVVTGEPFDTLLNATVRQSAKGQI
ncbi:malonyl-CoA decarboxylase [Novosphingobium sp. MMS21-SN21R]|uniref:malonyl-CoA decarboxylase n=1 Tax=Novosphingobium sp. MMS21-SN21R TaxID=2969298 RepID=UPI0028840BF6|nr:malonyl-CoA decarboxylase [Novosphingobium sp. MMS21-SN21R]MDT0510220.1 malonyl-CoA decarboxylase [Novosphingobium sp. MMS21-SN21R]